MYKLMKKIAYNAPYDVVMRVADKMIIPMNPDNTDYQAYLEWVAEGNTPEPADGAN